MIESIFNIALLIFVYMTGWFLLALWRKRNDIADIAWGLGFVLISLIMLFKNPYERSTLVFFLVLLWGLRLAIHIYLRNRGKKEDFRYKKWREEWGKYFLIRTYLQVFLLQGFFMLLISLPIIAVGSGNKNSGLGFIDIVGIFIWLTGFYFETVGDWQLNRFKSDPKNKGKVMKEGLWRYTRHPNYFGEVTQWWGIFLISLSVPYWHISIVGPSTISVLILFVSGIPMLEKKYLGNKEFEEYKAKTSAFFPLPSKSRL